MKFPQYLPAPSSNSCNNQGRKVNKSPATVVRRVYRYVALTRFYVQKPAGHSKLAFPGAQKDVQDT